MATKPKATKTKKSAAPGTIAPGKHYSVALAGVATASTDPGVSDAELEKLRISAMLESKRSALAAAEADLKERLVIEPKEIGQQIAPAIQQVVIEIANIRRRLTALWEKDAFQSPPPEEEKALLDAIQAVGAAADATKSAVALVQAALKLVNTYRAKDTVKPPS